MSTRVIIERRVKKTREVEALEIMRELRVMALHRKGYFCGETMQSLDDPSTYAVLSIWQRPEDWEAWRENPERKEMAKKLERLLVAPEKVSVYVTISF